MSVRVNLLPAATKERDKATKQRAIAGGAILALLLVLGGVYWWAGAQVSAAEDELLAEQARSAELRAEQAELVAFQDLQIRRDAADERIIAALAGEVSLPAILQDLAFVMPADSQMDSLALSLSPSAVTNDGVQVGVLSINGQTLTAHAPGVERLLLELGKIATFGELHLNTSTLREDDDTIATFAVEGIVRREARTGRYEDGVPEALR